MVPRVAFHAAARDQPGQTRLQRRDGVRRGDSCTVLVFLPTITRPLTTRGRLRAEGQSPPGSMPADRRERQLPAATERTTLPLCNENPRPSGSASATRLTEHRKPASCRCPGCVFL